MRPGDSAYDRQFGAAEARLWAALEAAGHTIRTTAAGYVVVDEQHYVTPTDWQRIAVTHDGDTEDSMEEILLAASR